MTRTLGAILAGGLATRFGSDKALALLDGTALIDRVADRLRPQVDGLGVASGAIGTPPRRTPAKAGVQLGNGCASLRTFRNWTPAFAGVRRREAFNP